METYNKPFICPRCRSQQTLMASKGKTQSCFNCNAVLISVLGEKDNEIKAIEDTTDSIVNRKTGETALKIIWSKVPRNVILNINWENSDDLYRILDNPEYKGIPTYSKNLEYANFGLRLGAWFLDGLIVFFPLSFLITIIAKQTGNPQLTIRLLTLVISWLYFAITESSNMQASIGKKIMGIKVVDYSGNKIFFGKASVRFFSKIISALILLIGYIMAGFTEKKQALHDLIANTYVIKNK